MKTMKTLAAILVLAAPAAADEVILRNGSVFSGVVREQGERVTIVMDYGTMSFKRIDVREIRRSEDPLKELELKTVTATTPKDHFDLALWARDRGLKGRSDELLNKVIALDPDHDGARKALGYEKFQGQWLKDDELMVARGFVKHGGKWLKRETVEQLLAQENAESIEIERQKTQRLAVETTREIELQKIELERERIEADLEIARRTRWWTTGWQTGPSVIVLPNPAVPAHHPGYGPGRTLPPGGQPSLTPPFPSTTPSTTKGGGPPVSTTK